MSLFDALLLDPAPFHIWISVRTDGQLGSGLITDPYDGSKVGSVYRFDLTMAKFSATANVVVHLGPGTFPTQGYGGTTPAWQVHAGMKILGSGMGVTTIKLDVTSPQNGKHYFAVGHDLTKKVDAFEISDLTIDLNLAAFAGAGVTSAAGAVRAMGNHARIRRVNAIRWGTRSPGITCYVLSLIAGAPDSGDSSLWEMVNFGIEECYVSYETTNPGISVGNSVVNLINLGSQDDLATTKETQAKSPFVRNCFVDGGVATPEPSPTAGRGYIRAISMAWCRGGVVEGNQIYNVDVVGPYSGGSTYAQQLTVRDIIVRNNYAKSIARGLFLDLFRQGSTLVVAGTAPTLTIVGTVGTVSGLNLNLATLASGDRILLATSGGSHNGMYQVRDVIVGSTSSFVITTAASTPSPVDVTSVTKLKSVTRAIVEGNVIELVGSTAVTPNMAFEITDNAAAVGPDYGHGDMILRNNKVRYVDGASGSPAFTGQGSRVAGVKMLNVSSNVVFSDQPNPLQNSRCGAVMYFNNRTPRTQLVQGLNAVTAAKYGELETDVDDMFVMSFLQD